MGLRMSRKDLEYELGRYKKKVIDQQKEISELRKAAEGYKQTLKANEALIAAVFSKVGADDEHPFAVAKEDIRTAMAESEVRARLDTGGDGYLFRVVKRVSPDADE